MVHSVKITDPSTESSVAGYHLVDVDFISRSYTKGQSGMLLETLTCIKLILSTKMLRIYLKHSG